eukprot:4166920-Prymnesium_polylepis.1
MAGRSRGGARDTRSAFMLSEIAIRVLPVCGIARPDVHKMAGYARTELGCTFELAYGMFLGALGMPKPTIIDR